MKKKFEYFMGKEERNDYQHFLMFLQYFLPFFKYRKHQLHDNACVLSANAFNLNCS